MRMKVFCILSFALALAAAAPALADPPPAHTPPQRVFISPSGEPFREPAGGRDPFDDWFDQADANHDGAIDRAEFRADAERFFHRLDANGDGVVDGFEINAYETKIAPELTAGAEGSLEADFHTGDDHSKHDKHGKGGHDAAGGIEQLIDEAEPVAGAEFDFNGRVSLANWMRAADERFDLLDVGKTGRLTREALKARLHPQKAPHA